MKMTFFRNNIFAALCAAILIALLSACSSDPTPESVAKKIGAGEKLSEKDYSSMIDYCGKYAEKAQPLFDVINQQSDADTAAATADATAKLADLYQEYSYLDVFRGALYAADESALGAENVKKLQKYSKFEAFPLPGGAGRDLEDPSVVGQIEEMPLDSSQVIATGDGEAVDIPVK